MPRGNNIKLEVNIFYILFEVLTSYERHNYASSALAGSNTEEIWPKLFPIAICKIEDDSPDFECALKWHINKL